MGTNMHLNNSDLREGVTQISTNVKYVTTFFGLLYVNIVCVWCTLCLQISLPVSRINRFDILS